MATDEQLAELLVQKNLMSGDQLKTALEFQRSIGGDLRSIVVKMGYVKDNVLAGLVAEEEHVETTAEITPEVIDFDVVRVLGKDVLEKHQILPLRSDSPHSVVLAMADPNDLRAIEEVQFLLNKSVEPAVATKAGLRRALNQLGELAKQQGAKAAPAPAGKRALSAERLKVLKQTPIDKLLRAYLVLQIEKGELSVDELLARVGKL